MNYADKIVYKHGSYVAEDCVPLEISGKLMYLKHIKEASKYGMQQVRSEFADFVPDRGRCEYATEDYFKRVFEWAEAKGLVCIETSNYSGGRGLALLPESVYNSLPPELPENEDD